MAFGSSFGSTFGASSSGPFGGIPGTSRNRPLTLRELMLLDLAKKSQHKNPGFLGEVLHGGGKILGSIGHPIGWTFHQLERPFHGVEQGMYQSNQALNQHKSWLDSWKQFGKGFEKGLVKGDSKSGADVLKTDTIPSVAHFAQHHRVAAGIAGFGVDVVADPLSFASFGVKGTKAGIAASRKILNPSGWHDIVQAGKALKTADPEKFRYRTALNRLDKQLYRQAKQIAKRNKVPFQNKDLNWMEHHFKHNPTNIYEPDLVTQRSDLAAQAHWEALRHDPRYKTLGFAGKDIFQFGKNVALKEHNSALAKLFSNVSRYGPYYPLSIIGLHSGIRTDVIEQLTKGLAANGLPEKEVQKQVKEYIKAFQMNRVKKVLAAGEGVSATVEDKQIKAILRITAKRLDKYHNIHGISFPDMASQIHKFDPRVVAHLGMAGQTEGTIANKLRKLAEAAHNPDALSRLSQVANPDIAAKGLRKIDNKNFKGIVISGRAKSFLGEYNQRFLKDENLHPFLKKLEHYRGIVKRGYTGANPFGYAIRNSLTDVWNAALSHTPVVRGMLRNVPKAHQMIKGYDAAAKKLMAGKELTSAETRTFMQVHKMHDMGILSGLFAKDVQEDKSLADQLHPKTGRQIIKETKGRRLLHGYATGAVHANETRENTGRVAHYLYRVSKGEAPEEAASAVKAAHFDYQDITPFEQNALKSVFPFYTWYRKNIPFQLRKLPEKPGQFMRYVHLQQESQQASGDKKQGLMPDYLKDSPTAIRLPFGHNLYANPALGSQDLQSVEHPIHDVITKIGPPANLAYAYLTGKDNFGGTDLNKKRLTPTNPLLANILDKIPGLDVGNTQREVHGQKIQAKGISPWMNFLINQVPAAQLVTTANPVSVGHRGLPSFNIPGFGPFPTGSAASYFGGQSLTSVDQQAQSVGEQQQVKNEATAMLQKLYDNGTLRPKRRRNTRFDRLFTQASGG